MPGVSSLANSGQSGRSPDILFIDLAPLAYAALHRPAIGSLKHEGTSTGAVLASVQAFLKAVTACPDAVPVLFFDEHSSWRERVVPSFRQVDPTDTDRLRLRGLLATQMPVVKMLFETLGVPVCRAADSLAGDVAALLLRELSPSWHIELHSKEPLWLQGLAVNTWWFNPMKDLMITRKTFSAHCPGAEGIFQDPSAFVMAQAIAGDDSDGLPGVHGIGLKSAGKFAATTPDLVDFWTNVDEDRADENRLLTRKGVSSDPVHFAPRVALKTALSRSMAAPETQTIYERNMAVLDWARLNRLPGGVDCQFKNIDAVDTKGFAVAMASFGFESQASECLAYLASARKQLGADWGRGLKAIQAATRPDDCVPVEKLELAIGIRPGPVVPQALAPKPNPFRRFVSRA